MESLRSSGEGKAVGTEAHCSSHKQKFDRIMRLFESSHASMHLHKKEIAEEFKKLTHTPDHPPYASMIQRAITKLNEREGSSEETISKFIEAEYEDLPIAHRSLLSRHLQKLVAKGEIVCPSRNCYVLSFENCDLLHKLRKEQKHLRRVGKGRKNRQNKVKGVKSQKEQKIKESQELNQVTGKIFEGINPQSPKEEREIECIGEQTEQGHAELIEEQNEVEELRFKTTEEQVEAEEDNEGNEEHNQMQEHQNQQQNLVLRQAIEVLVVEKNQAEESNSVENHNKVTEAEHQKEIEEEVIEEQKSEKFEEKNQINDQEREAREEQVQLPEVHIEAMVGQIDAQAAHFEVSEEEKRLQEQQMEVCCQIIDLRNTLVHFTKKEKENEATMSSQNMDLFGSLRLTKEESMELLMKTNEIQRRLIDIIHMEMSESNNSYPAIRRQEELLEEHLQQTRNPGKGQPQQEQQLEVCSQLKVPEYQQNTNPPSENEGPADSMQLEQNTQNQSSSHERQPEDKITTLDELVVTQSEQIKLRDQQEASKSQPKLMTVSLDGPCDSRHDKNENRQMVIQRREKVLEDSSRTAEETINFSRDGDMSRPEAEKSYLVAFIDDQLQNSRHCGPKKLPKSQLGTSSHNVLQAKQSEQIKRRDQQEATKSQPKSMAVSFDGPHNLPHYKNENTQIVIQRREELLENNFRTAEERIKFSGDANMSRPETEKSYLVVFLDEQLQNSRHRGPEKLPKSQLVTSSLNMLQEPSLDHQQQTTRSNETKGPEYKQQPENPIDRSHVEPEQKAEEDQIQTQEQMQRRSQSLIEKLSNSELTADICVTKLCEQSKEILNQYQRRQLRPRIPRPSQCDPVVLSIEDDQNLTLASKKSEMTQKLKPSARKRPREPSLKTVVEISHSRGQQKNHQCQHKRLKYHPTADSAITSQQQQQVRQLRRRGKGFSQSELDFLQPQRREQNQKPQGRGRPQLKSNVDAAMREMLDLHHPHHEQQRRGRGRPPKLKTNAAANLEADDHHNDNVKKPSHRGRGRPPKSNHQS